jgi:hypothetical protein
VGGIIGNPMLWEEAYGIQCCGRKHIESNAMRGGIRKSIFNSVGGNPMLREEASGIQCCGRKHRESNAMGGSIGNPMLWEEA